MGLREFFKDLFYLRNILIVILTPIVLLPLLIVIGTPDTNMLFIGGLIVASAIEHWNIHTRIALRVLMLVGAEPRWLMLGLMGPTWFLSMWISNTATTAMMIPIANAILLQLKQTDDRYKSETHEVGTDNKGLELDERDYFDSLEVRVDDHTKESNDKESKNVENGDTHQKKKEKEIEANEATELETFSDSVTLPTDNPAFLRLSKAVSLCIAYAANCGGIGSLTGTGPNLVFKGQLDQVYEKYGLDSPITFANWLGFGVPTSLVLVVIVWVWLQIMFIRCGQCCGNKDKERDRKVKEVIDTQYKNLGKMTFGQGAIMGHFIVLALLWVTRDFGGEYGWGHIFKKGYVKDGVPAILVACSLFIFPSKIPKVFCRRPSGRREQLKPLMSWTDAVLKVPWGVVFLLGGGFAMATASKESGLSAMIGDKLAVLDYLQPWVLNMVLCYIVAAMTEVTSNTATCTLMMPILATLAINLKQNPTYIMFPTTIASSFAFMLPVATPPNAVVFSYGYVRVVDMVKAGFILNVIGVLVLIASTETIGDALFNLRTMPPEIMATFDDTS